MTQQPLVRRAGRSRSTRTAALAACLLWMLALMGGCALSEPGPHDFQQDAAQALEDLASEVATAQIVLEQRQSDEIFSTSVVVILVAAEEAGAKAAEDFASLQPPRGLQQTYDDVTTALQDGSNLLGEVRIAAASEDASAMQELNAELAETRTALTDLAAQLR